MMEFMRAGGVGIWIVTLFGILGLAHAIRFTINPSERRLATIRRYSRATGFTIIGTVSLNLASVFSKIPRHPEWSQPDQYPTFVMVGLGESLTPAILGFLMLGMMWLVVAVGQRRFRASDGGALEV